MNPILSKTCDVVFHFIPMNRNVVFFSSFNGLYNDNPRYISEKLHSLYPNTKLVWVVASRANKNDIPFYVIKVKYGTLKYYFYKNRAGIIVDNYIGLLSKHVNKRSFKDRLIKKKGQINFSTWHGTPLKRIGQGFMSKEAGGYITSSTCFVLNSTYIANIFKKDISSEVPIKLLGSPRNDLLFRTKDTNIIVRTKKKLGLPLDKKIVIYAPTYRSTNRNIDGDFYSVYIQPQDIERCLQSFSRHFGGDWVFVYRVHQHVLNEIEHQDINSSVINGNLHDDMAEYLLVSDALITDYSGSLFDYTITRKPCVLYAPDYYEYKNDGRGTYMEIERLPYPIAYDVEGLLKEIDNYDEVTICKKIDSFNKEIGLVDDGEASERIVKQMDDEVHFG